MVIGGGALGAAAAYQLALRGVSVTLVEAGELASGTTRRSFAWLNANDKPPLVYQRLNEDGIQAHRRLRERLSSAPWLHETGSIRFATDSARVDELEARVERLRATGYPSELISPARAAELEPRVDFSGALAAAHFPGEGWAHGPTLVRAVAAAAAELGARVLTQSPVTAIEERASGVEVRAGSELLSADVVVVAGGRLSDQVARQVGFELPLAPTCGLLAVTSPLEGPPESVVYAPGVHFRPDADGRLVLQDDETDRTVGPDTPETPDLPGCALLLERARAFVPALGSARIEEARVGIRPMPADGYPVVGPTPGHERIYLVVSHSGLTLGPLLGEIAAAELVNGEPDARLATFRPGRWLVRA